MSDFSSDRAIPPVALALGLGGLLPFAFATLAVWAGWRSPSWPQPAFVLQAYGAVILSFLGGIRWGLALRMTESRRQSIALGISVLPSLAAWLALLLPPASGLFVLAVLFATAGVADLGIGNTGAPPWFRRLRIILSVGAVSLLLVAATGIHPMP
jgi:hypothetical protein